MVMLLVAAPAGAQLVDPESSDEPVHVVADSLEVDNKSQVASFLGKVKASQGDVTITCDHLQVFYDRDDQAAKKTKKAAQEPTGGVMDDGGRIRKIMALGHVKIVQKNRIGVGRKATYWAGGRKMLLEGQATVWRGKNQVSGEKITVFLDQDRAIVHGKPGKRVSVTIVPQKKKVKKK
jgi:lipopolysaccharide export system protein LptA